MERTCYEYLGPSGQSRGVPPPPLETPWEGGPLIDLPRPGDTAVEPVTVADAIEKRESRRSFTGGAMTLDELSWLLWCTQGVKEVAGKAATFRTVPSAGARHAFDTFLLVNRVEGLDPGLYRYLALGHRLGPVNGGPGVAGEVADGCLGQEMVTGANVTFLWAADVRRMTWRYGERGYRYLHLDAGHVCQNLYLAAETVGCGVCAIAAFDDYALNRTLGLDGTERFVIYCAAAGRV